MIFIPYSTALRLNQRPYITYFIAFLCVFIFYLQVDNYDDIYQSASDYCSSIQAEENPQYNILIDDIEYCSEILIFVHEQGVDRVSEYIQEELEVGGLEGLVTSDFHRVMSQLENDYVAFDKDAVDSLDGALMHFPKKWWDLWSMITSSFAHADFFHIFFNLIFFMAFAPALEVLVNNKYRFSLIVVGLCVVTGLSYSLAVLISVSSNVPTLGLSGVVMGMIGLSAFMMPRARIRCFLWFIALIRTYYIPAWILAAWYIGWDTWALFTSGNSGGVNLISHVSGGFAGYLIGYIWFKDQKASVQDELDEEIEHMRAERDFGSTHLTYSGGRRELANQYHQKQAKRDHNAFMDQLNRYVRTGRDSDAIALFLADYELQKYSVQIFEELFERAKGWGASRTVLCIGRTVINLLVEQRKYARAILYVEHCQAIVKEFVLADPDHVLILAEIAKENHQYNVSYQLVADSYERYGNSINTDQCDQLLRSLPEMN